jgi:hypothetical protein
MRSGWARASRDQVVRRRGVSDLAFSLATGSLFHLVPIFSARRADSPTRSMSTCL